MTLQYSCPDIRPEDLIEHNRLLLEGKIDPGEKVRAFEAAISERLDIPPTYVIATGSATAGLDAAYRCFKSISSWQLPFFTWASTYSVLPVRKRRWYASSEVIYNRSLPDCSKPTVIVELWGNRLQLDIPRGARVVIDAAQNILDPKHRDIILNPFIESYVIYSAGPVKQITCGRGGCIISRQFERIRLRRMVESYLDSGTIGRDRILAYGINAQLTEPSAALGLAQLSRFDDMQRHRQSILKTYESALVGSMFTRPDNSSGHLAVLLTASSGQRDSIAGKLVEGGIESGVHYRLDGKFSPPIDSFEADIDLSRRVLTLPCHCRMTVQDAERVAKIVKEAI